MKRFYVWPLEWRFLVWMWLSFILAHLTSRPSNVPALKGPTWEMHQQPFDAKLLAWEVSLCTHEKHTTRCWFFGSWKHWPSGFFIHVDVGSTTIKITYSYDTRCFQWSEKEACFAYLCKTPHPFAFNCGTNGCELLNVPFPLLNRPALCCTVH